MLLRSEKRPAEIVRLALGWVVPFALVLYLGMRGGGYDDAIRDEAAIVVWILVAAFAMAGLLRAGRFSRAAWAIGGLLVLLTLWTTLGISWSTSAEKSVEEAVRIAAYLGTFMLGVAVQGRDGMRTTASSIAAAIGVIGAVALLSRLHPGPFPVNELAEASPESRGRLNYPLNEWNALGGLIATGLPLAFFVAMRARHLAAQIVATAAVPVMVVALYYTFSRSALIGLALAGVVFLAAHPRRLQLVPLAAIVGVCSAVGVLAAASRDALADGAGDAVAEGQADEMTVVMLVLIALAAALRWGLAVAERRDLIPRPSVPAPIARRALIGAGVVVVVVAVAAGGLGRLSDGWEDFKQPISAGGSERFEDVSGNSRYQYWEAAIDANAEDPLIGIGPGTFELWWARTRPIVSFVRNAHSLYVETLGELGVVGLLIVLALVAAVLVAVCARMRGADEETRSLLAAILAACVSVVFLAALNIVWEVAVFPIVILLLAAAVTARPEAAAAGRERLDRVGSAVAITALAAVCAVATWFPLQATRAVEGSQEAAEASDLELALERADEAVDSQPYAASGHIQRALVLQAQGDLDEAVLAAREATHAEATNWRTWYVLREIEKDRGEKQESLEAYRRAISLNPRSPLFVIGS